MLLFTIVVFVSFYIHIHKYIFGQQSKYQQQQQETPTININGHSGTNKRHQGRKSVCLSVCRVHEQVRTERRQLNCLSSYCCYCCSCCQSFFWPKQISESREKSILFVKRVRVRSFCEQSDREWCIRLRVNGYFCFSLLRTWILLVWEGCSATRGYWQFRLQWHLLVVTSVTVAHV